MTSTRRRAAGAVVLAFSLAACQDRSPTLAPPAGAPPALLTAVRCQGSRAPLTVRCGAPDLPGGIDGLIVGGQNLYVFLQETNVAYESGMEMFEFDVTVQNLIPQSLGTADGATGTAEGVRVFFSMPPTATAGSGDLEITVLSDGQGSFTEAGQHYYQYAGAALGGDGILSENETSSARHWVFLMSPDVVSFEFEVYVAAAVQYPQGWVDVTPPADTMAAGGGQALAATVRSVVGNPLPGQTVTWGSSDAGVATVDGSGNVTGVSPGLATITATAGTRTGSATIAVCPSLAVDGVHLFDLPEGAALCLAGGAAGAEYTVVPINTSDSAGIALSLTGSGIIPPTEPPSPIRLARAPLAPGGPRLRPDLGWESRLRRRERSELPRLAASAPSRTPRRVITPGVPAVGALMDLNVETDNSCSTLDSRTGRVMAVGTHVIVMADTMNPSGGLTAGDYAALADSFDLVIHPTVAGNFGAPADIDGNGRVIAFYTRAVNELTPPGSGAYVGGFFFSRDLFPTAACPTSNVGEMFYMLAADPAGEVNGNLRSASFVRQVTLGTLAHEFEHLINASRRMYVNTPWNGEFEDTWLDEGLAHVAEELVFYQGAGLAPRANLDVADIGDGAQREDAFFKYQEANFGRLRQWLVAPEASGFFQDDDDLATRGAAWAFLRYAADRRGGTESGFWAALVNTGDTGLANLQAALGTDPLPWARDFAAAVYLDDANLPSAAAAAYTHPSWDFRSLYQNLDYAPGPGCSCAYELAVRDPANGVAEGFTLAEAGAAGYVRLGVGAGGFAGVALLSGGNAPPATVRLAVIRRR